MNAIDCYIAQRVYRKLLQAHLRQLHRKIDSTPVHYCDHHCEVDGCPDPKGRDFQRIEDMMQTAAEWQHWYDFACEDEAYLLDEAEEQIEYENIARLEQYTNTLTLY